MATREDLETEASKINQEKTELDKLPNHVDDKVGDLMAAVRVGGIVGGIGSLGVITVINETVVIDYLEDNRDDINRSINKAIEQVQLLQSGNISTPVNLVDCAVNWRTIAGSVTEALNYQTKTSLRSEWVGIAADRYFDVSLRQEKALQAIPTMCEKIAVSLEAVAVKMLDLYKKLLELIVKLTGEVATSIGKLVEKGPLAIKEIGEIAKLASSVANAIVSVIGEVKSYALSEMIEANRIAAVTNTQYGLPGNKWPSSVLDGLTYDDATVLDGTNTWSVNTDRK